MSKSKSLDIARDLAIHFEAGKSVQEAIAAVREAFPSATSAELKEACQAGRDHVEHWHETIGEDVRRLFQMIALCEPQAKIDAAFARAKRRVATIRARS